MIIAKLGRDLQGTDKTILRHTNITNRHHIHCGDKISGFAVCNISL